MDQLMPHKFRAKVFRGQVNLKSDLVMPEAR